MIGRERQACVTPMQEQDQTKVAARFATQNNLRLR
jgi:hypothetical protein